MYLALEGNCSRTASLCGWGTSVIVKGPTQRGASFLDNPSPRLKNFVLSNYKTWSPGMYFGEGQRNLSAYCLYRCCEAA
jgi:hypothetical protein